MNTEKQISNKSDVFNLNTSLSDLFDSSFSASNVREKNMEQDAKKLDLNDWFEFLDLWWCLDDEE